MSAILKLVQTLTCGGLICSILFFSYDEILLDTVVERTNIVYGGWTPDVTNVIFTNGDIDPWHALSVLEDVNESSPAILVPGNVE